ncbi:MAG: hypothetical protein LKF79_01075 [Solobacterium sp.]|jgi:hypothetical protein|nr:hypothetical protein [Solobacterium sp.]MCH4221907.1 hypothetical protein [Solobacterium sp.]MCH4265220.1 hypothetical protein [Solobacterium sp.]
MTANKEKNKEEFLKYADKQRTAVRNYTDYWLFGVIIAVVVILLFVFGNIG